MNGINGPTTYQDLRRTMIHYNRFFHDFNVGYLMVRRVDWRQTANLNAYQVELRVANLMLPFLNKLHSRRSNAIVPGVSEAIREIVPNLRALDEMSLESLDLHPPMLDVIGPAFRRLTAVNGVSSTTASKILTALKPNLCVMWDPDIRSAYCGPLPDDGATYRFYIETMREVAVRLVNTAHVLNGIENLAERLSDDLRESRIRNCECHIPPLPLAKFINDYNWLNFSISCKG